MHQSCTTSKMNALFCFFKRKVFEQRPSTGSQPCCCHLHSLLILRPVLALVNVQSPKEDNCTENLPEANLQWVPSVPLFPATPLAFLLSFQNRVHPAAKPISFNSAGGRKQDNTVKLHADGPPLGLKRKRDLSYSIFLPVGFPCCRLRWVLVVDKGH